MCKKSVSSCRDQQCCMYLGVEKSVGARCVGV